MNISKTNACPKQCKVLQYGGKVVYDDVYSWAPNSNWAQFSYEIDPPKKVTVYQEYVVYDAIGIIGSVGGTFGMFIGFSFTSMISGIISFCSKVLRSKMRCGPRRSRKIKMSKSVEDVAKRIGKFKVEALVDDVQELFERIRKIEAKSE